MQEYYIDCLFGLGAGVYVIHAIPKDWKPDHVFAPKHLNSTEYAVRALEPEHFPESPIKQDGMNRGCVPVVFMNRVAGKVGSKYAGLDGTVVWCHPSVLSPIETKRGKHDVQT